LKGRSFRTIVKIWERSGQDLLPEFPNTKLVRETPNGRKEAQEPIDGVPPRICETVKEVLVSDQSTRIERAEAKGIIVKYPSGLRISCEQDLEATVKQESFKLVRSNPASDSIRSF
jgi:hypothetical protein